MSIIRALCPDSQKRISEVYPHAFPLCDFLLIRLSSIITLPLQHHRDPRTAEVDPRYQSDLCPHPFSPKCPAVIKPWDTAEQFQLQGLPRALTRRFSWEKKDTDCSLRQVGVGHQAAGLGLFRPGSILNKLSSLKHTNVGFSLFPFPAWKALLYGNSSVGKSREEENIQRIYLHVSTPPKIPPQLTDFSEHQCCVWSGNNKKLQYFSLFIGDDSS